MTVHQDYEIKINLNELIEKRIPCCDLLHPDHCLTEKQVSEIAHDIRMDLNLHDLYKQVDQHKTAETQKENDDLYKDLEDLFI